MANRNYTKPRNDLRALLVAGGLWAWANRHQLLAYAEKWVDTLNSNRARKVTPGNPAPEPQAQPNDAYTGATRRL
ncbi:hypothetical protein HC891_21000 [Candidatus Gracilibacteria bacterium]|nr:hypothetical protein [Candidatus Gracilibacteria bacterium]